MSDLNRAINRNYRSMLRASSGFLADGDVKKIRRALNISIDACSNRTTITGDNPVLHSLAVARMVAGEMSLGTTSVISAILHFSVDHQAVDISKIKGEFGAGVGKILSGFSKVNAIESVDAVKQADLYRKLILSLADDVRVIVIKLVDRLIYMRNLQSVPANKQLLMASETYFVYAPIAYRLGFYTLKSEMEDLSMQYLEPEQYKFIKERLRQTTSSRNRFIREFTTPLRQKLDNLNISYSIKGRTKSVHSIWQKMQKQAVGFEEVYDIFAVRIIVDSDQEEHEKSECWQVYSVVTDIYQPNPSRLRDWISVPKSNGYESLHTTVIGLRGKWVEVQIRSTRMDEVAEKGLAAHYRYKGVKGGSGGVEHWLSRMRELLESSDREDDAFIDQVKSGLYSDEIFVFTPKGELKQLAAGATVLDFAFEIHTEVGTQCIGAKVNGKNVTIKHVLSNGDHVSVLTSKNQKPKRDWLSSVITGKARTSIKQALNEEKMKSAEEGKEILTRRLKNWKIPYNDTLVVSLLNHYGLKKAQDLYYKISVSEIELLDIKEYITKEEKREISGKGGSQEPATTLREEKEPVREASYGDFLIIENKVEGIDYKLAKCCNPVFGDKVFGFVTISEGVKIHRTACPNAENLITRYPYRIVPVRWSQTAGSPTFLASLKITGVADMGVASAVSNMLTDEKIIVRGMNYNIIDDLYEGIVQVNVPNTNILHGLIKKMNSIKGIIRVIRSDS